MTSQVIRLDWSLVVGYARLSATPVRLGPWALLLQGRNLDHALGGDHAPPLKQVGAPDLLPVLGGEVAESQDVLAGLGHQLSRPGEFGGEHGAHLIPLPKDRFFALLRKHRAQGSGHYLLGGFRHRLEQVPWRNARGSAASSCPAAFAGSR